MTINLKDYIRHAEKCSKEYDNDFFICLSYSFAPRNIPVAKIEEKFFQKRVRIGKCQKLNHIVIPDFFAATLHGEIIKSGEWIYKDSSIAGTQINKKYVNGKTVPLNIGDTLLIGDFVIEVLITPNSALFNPIPPIFI